MDAFIGLLFVLVLPVGAFLLGRRSGYRRARREQTAAPTLVCQCGGALCFHDHDTGRCAHREHGDLINGVREIRDCTCTRFIDAANPYWTPPVPPAVAGSGA